MIRLFLYTIKPNFLQFYITKLLEFSTLTGHMKKNGKFPQKGIK